MRLGGKKIFIVEDDASNLAIAMTILQGEGAAVTCDRFGKETISRLFKSLPIDIILLDLNLSNGTTGYHVLEQIRQMVEFAEIPVVAVTASDPSHVIGQLRQAGFNGLISKPVRVKTFGPYLEAILRGCSVWGDRSIGTFGVFE
jgi:two-component system sensor histidine kinase ChiS